MAQQKKKYYVVWKGRKPGIYTDWDSCKAQVHGFAGATYKSFPTKQEAESAFAGAYEKQSSSTKASSLKEAFGENNRPVVPSIAVDAACSGNPGILEYQGVDTQSGRRLFYGGPFACGTNNLGEFLAIVHGLQWLQQDQSDLPIYTDSQTALAWIRNKKIKTTLPKTKETEKLFLQIEAAEEWLSTNQYSNPLIKWETTAWGEIPADFGRK